MTIGKLGVFQGMDGFTGDEAAAFAKRLDDWGYGALWFGEGLGRNSIALAACLLGQVNRLTIATGIANIYARDPMATVGAQQALAEWFDGRFLLGLGVSHGAFVEQVRGHSYGKPVETMRAYLDAMARVAYQAPAPAHKPLTVLAALGPKMLALAAERTDGAHPYNVTPEHTAEARRILGPDKLLCPEQMIVFETDPAKARAIARRWLAVYLTLPNYCNNWLRTGFRQEDLDHGGSDRLIDGVIAWGDEAAIRARIQEHWDAGADHVCIQALSDDSGSAGLSGKPDERILALLAPAKA